MTVIEALRSKAGALMSVEEAARIMDIHRVSVYAMIKAKKFPVIKFGPAQTKIDPVTLAEFIEKRTALP